MPAFAASLGEGESGAGVLRRDRAPIILIEATFNLIEGEARPI
jgi:hypothetical protein